MIDNATKSVWHPVHTVGSGRATDFLVVADDPINGNVVGCYSDMGTAHYVARLHNEHVSGHVALREVDLMYQSEIHYCLVGMWDGGIDWFLNHTPDYSDPNRCGNEATIEKALVAVANAARREFPESTYARLYASDITVQQDQRSEETLANELADLVGSYEIEFDATDRDRPDSLPWIVSVGDVGYSGSTQREALLFALTELAKKET